MNVMAVVSVIREMCLYLATFGYLTVGMVSLEGSLLVLGTAVLCCIICRFWHPDSILKYLPLLTCGLMFVRGTAGIQIAAAVPVIGYLFLKIRNGHWEAGYPAVISTLKAGSAAYGIFLFFLWIYAADVAKGTNTASVPFFALFLILSVFSMRLQRDSALMSFGTKYRLLSLIPVILTVVLAFILTSPPARALFVTLMRLFGEYVVYPLLVVFAYVMLAIVNILKYPVLWLLRRAGMHSIDESEMGFEDLGDMSDIFDTGEVTGSPILDMLWKALPAILLLVLVIFIIRRISRNTGIGAASAGSYQREAITRTGPKRRTLKDLLRPPLSPVREAYRQYLKLCSSSQIPADGSLASDEVLRLSSQHIPAEDARKLRELWLPVRYGNAEDNDPAAAKQLMKNIRKQFRTKR
ncbi:MAG: hypothetical protein IIZ57_11805 [Solobacterium sp.]|nr:hypothetical protein [Solobacterium sp.]